MSEGDRNYCLILLMCDRGNFSKMAGIAIAPKNLKPSIQSVLQTLCPTT
ncbi:hypothetical protein [Chlorogloea sp. CCALA 695]|nr:hypothetical protein [Chlorogloea sp. CCALA 695]